MHMSPMKTRAARFLLLAAVGGTIAGCQTVRGRRLQVTSQALKAGKAIAILSTSADEPCRFNAAYLEIVNTRKTFGGAMMQLQTATAKSDFPDRFGFFDAFVLEPGDYSLHLRSSNPMLHYRRSDVAAFHLEPGEIRYLGNVHVAGCGSLAVGVGDEWASVRAALPRRFPGIDIAAVTVQGMVPGGALARRSITSPPPALALREPFRDPPSMRPPAEGEEANGEGAGAAKREGAASNDDAPGPEGSVAPSSAEPPPVVPSSSPPPAPPVSTAPATLQASSTKQPSEDGPESFQFLPIDPVRFALGLSSGAGWLKASSADPQGIGRVGGTISLDVGLTFWDLASFSTSFGAMFPSDRGSFSQSVVGDGAPYRDSSTLQITNYSIAVGPRTPLLVLVPDAYSLWAAALFADYGWSWIAGSRSIENCVDCHKEAFDLPDGNFVRIGANIGIVSVTTPRVGLMLTLAYQRYLSGAALAQEVRAGFGFWL
jgi:hypothetical protein